MQRTSTVAALPWRVTAALLSFVMVVVWSVAVGPEPASAASKTLTVSQVMAKLKGVTITNSHLKQRTTLVAWTKVTEHKRGTFYVPTFETTNICVPGKPCSSLRSHTSLTPDGMVHYRLTSGAGQDLETATFQRSASVDGGYQHYSLNPFSWTWGDIWHWVVEEVVKPIWNHVIKACLDGVAASITELTSARVAAGALVKRGWLSARSVAQTFTKDNAVMAIGGQCVLGIANSFK